MWCIQNNLPNPLRTAELPRARQCKRCVQRATGFCVTCRPLIVEHSKMLLKCYCTPVYGIRPRYKINNISLCCTLIVHLPNFYVNIFFRYLRTFIFLTTYQYNNSFQNIFLQQMPQIPLRHSYLHIQIILITN